MALNHDRRKRPWSSHGCWKSRRAESAWNERFVASLDVAAAAAAAAATDCSKAFPLTAIMRFSNANEVRLEGGAAVFGPRNLCLHLQTCYLLTCHSLLPPPPSHVPWSAPSQSHTSTTAFELPWVESSKWYQLQSAITEQCRSGYCYKWLTIFQYKLSHPPQTV